MDERYIIFCRKHGRIELDVKTHIEQIRNNQGWLCPECQAMSHGHWVYQPCDGCGDWMEADMLNPICGDCEYEGGA